MMHDQHEPLKPGDHGEQQTSPAQISEVASGGSRRMLLLGIVLVCLVAAGVTGAVLASPGGSPAGDIAGPGPTSSQPGHVAGAGSSPAAIKTRSSQPRATKTRAAQSAAPHASSRAITGANVTSKGVAKSALQWPPQLQRQILRWWAGRGGAALTSVETQMGNAMQAAGLKLYDPMRVACVSLASSVGTAQAGPPIPYDVMQRLYAKSLAGLSRAATDCRTAISERADGDETVDVHLNHGLFNESRAEFAAMSKKLYTATAEIQALGR